MSVTMRRTWAWVVGVVCSLAIVALISVAVFDLQTGDSTASVIAGVVAVIGLAVSVITLIFNPPSAGSSNSKVRARGRGAIAAGGDMRGNAFGERSKVTGPPSALPPPAAPVVQRDVTAKGDGAISAGGDLTDNAVGEDSER